MALIACPGCGNQISDKATICPICGYQTETESIVTAEDVKQVPKSKMALTAKNMKAVLFIAGCALLIIAFLIITSSAYKDRQRSYEQYMAEYENALDMAEENKGGFLGSILYNGYMDVADGWKELADHEKKQLMQYRIGAVTSVVCGGVLISTGFLIAEKKRDGM